MQFEIVAAFSKICQQPQRCDKPCLIALGKICIINYACVVAQGSTLAAAQLFCRCIGVLLSTPLQPALQALANAAIKASQSYLFIECGTMA